MPPKPAKGVVAAGHETTAAAAETLLRAGGNAFDAVIGAVLTACVAEPVLASLGGGGFVLARPANGTPVLYDFFTHTPRQRGEPGQVDFYPIVADFGTATQEFHIGMGAMAVPGAVRGIFEVHRDLGRMPLGEVIQPALAAAREGVRMNGLQAYIFEVVGAIYRASAASREIFSSPAQPERLLGTGETLRLPTFAGFLEVLAREGDRLFYEGEVAARIADDCASGGGLLTRDDLAAYRVARRTPLELAYRDCRILTNPPPSCGGLLIAFALRLLEQRRADREGFGSHAHLAALAHAMALTNKARVDAALHDLHRDPDIERILDDEFLASYRRHLHDRVSFNRGTTHISVLDAAGNVAGMTVSNGEGSAYVVPGTGVMLNNMLGEEDLNPLGFHRWQPDQRIASMMAPTLLMSPRDGTIACGSGGSNRIRTAILQFLLNTIDFAMPLEAAIRAPRIHFEEGLLSSEPGYDIGALEQLKGDFPRQQHWAQPNLFFGGVHAVGQKGAGRTLSGFGDPRRGGVAGIVR